MLLEFRFWVSIQKQIFNQIAQYSLHLVTLISFLAILGMSDNIPSLDQIDFFSSFQFTLLLCFFYICYDYRNPTHFGFAATFIGSKIGHEISRFLFPKILISILILGYLRIIIGKSSLINEASANALLETSYILITLFITYFTKESLNKIDDERKEAENKVVMNNGLEKESQSEQII
jgi:hypothetical protein